MQGLADRFLFAVLDQVRVSRTGKGSPLKNTFDSFIWDESILLPGAALPPGYKKRPKKQCFRNAALDVFDNPDLIYCEGYAGFPSSPRTPIHHAWAITDYGQVIDSTWTDTNECVYLGVPLSRAYLWRWHADFQARLNECKEAYGTPIEDFDNGFPLVNGELSHGDWFAMHLIKKEIRDAATETRRRCEDRIRQQVRADKTS